MNLNKLLFLLVIIVVLGMFILWRIAYKKAQPVVPPISIKVVVDGVTANAASVILEARQDEKYTNISLNISQDKASGTLILPVGKWLMTVTSFTANKKPLQSTNILFSNVNSRNNTVNLFFYGQSYQDLVTVFDQEVTNQGGQNINLRGYGAQNAVYMIDSAADVQKSKFCLTGDDYQKIKQSGANTIRFYLQYDWLTQANEQSFFNYVDDQIKLARKNNLYLILNLHFFGMAQDVQANKADGFYKGDLYKNNYDIISFWQKISDRYKYEACIAGYDLLNEPACDETFTETKLYDLYAALIKTIRGNGDDHVVFVSDPVRKFYEVGKPYYITQDAFKKLQDSLVIYEYHWYMPIEFTHQGMFESPYFELGATYPFEKKDADYKGGYYSNPYWNNTPDGRWKLYKGHWVDLVAQANCTVDTKEDQFNVSLSAGKLKGKAWFDDVVIEKKNLATGKVEKLIVKKPNFSQFKDYEGWTTTPNQSKLPAGWYALNDPESTGIKFAWDMTNDHTGDKSGSLMIDGVSANWQGSNQWANWGQSGGALSTYYPIEKGYAYRASAWIMVKDNPGFNVSLALNVHRVKQYKVDKEYMKTRITDYYKKWADAHKVPLYCGEFGTTDPVQLKFNKKFDNKAQVLWVSDMINILNDTTRHWAYHCYKAYAGRGDLFGLFDTGVEDKALQKVIQTGF
ncbi:MAG: cellulase family glycosylhydrolase [Candidatus Margulisbacteria bacterium]|nr:cellulase family glycosylhydrolase [Candidatus Margulisiibacteriota bacterium]